MLLSVRDIERLEKKGYRQDFFMRLDSEGYAVLINYLGYCVFFNSEKKYCKVYKDRPLGCRIYPVIYDEEKGIIVDSLCSNRSSVTEEQKSKRGKKTLRLLERIDIEARRRSFNTKL
jgi:uncharacterized protein